MKYLIAGIVGITLIGPAVAQQQQAETIMEKVDCQMLADHPMLCVHNGANKDLISLICVHKGMFGESNVPLALADSRIKPDHIALVDTVGKDKDCHNKIVARWRNGGEAVIEGFDTNKLTRMDLMPNN